MDEEAGRLFDEACRAEERGDLEEAIALARRAARWGNEDAQLLVGNLLTDLDDPRAKEGLRWLKRVVLKGNGMAAWNLAMTYRVRGARPAYLRWIRTAARLGYGDAVAVLAEIERRMARREPWFMMKAGFVDALDVEWALEDVRDGSRAPAQVAAWAESIIRRREAAGVAEADQTRVLPVLWEMSRSGLTAQRAGELIYKLTG